MERQQYKPQPYKVSKFKELRKLIDPATQKIWNEEQIYLKDQLIEKDDLIGN